MRISTRSAAFLIGTTAVVGFLVSTIARDHRSVPYRVRRTDLTGWTLVSSHGTEAWIVALRPPERLAEALRKQVTEKAGPPLIGTSHAALPLVLRSEYSDSLQGELDVDSIVRMADADGIQKTSFRPTCIGRRRDPNGDAASEFLFVAFDAPGFWQLRGNLIPEHQEIAGNGTYDPAALSPILPLAVTGEDFERWLPLRVDPLTDCQAPLVIE